MAFEDIERLKEKVDKDPNSKLFIPLAEEYKKAGMFEEAIEVLTQGLERQPDYMSARVSLGKVYIERGMLEEARNEFEKVVSSIPDNLYAHKRLAEIYRDLGENAKAIKEFKTVLKLNPMDDWAATNLMDIEAGPKPVAKTEEAQITEEPTDEVAEIDEELPSEVPATEDVLEEVEDIPSEASEKILEAEEEGIEMVEEISEEAARPVEEVYKPSEAVFGEEEIASIGEEESEERPVSIQDAEQYIAQDKYVEALSVYREILSKDPDNRQVIQRAEELKALLKLLGKDKDQLIARLNHLSEHFKKRRDEFRRNT